MYLLLLYRCKCTRNRESSCIAHISSTAPHSAEVLLCDWWKHTVSSGSVLHSQLQSKTWNLTETTHWTLLLISPTAQGWEPESSYLFESGDSTLESTEPAWQTLLDQCAHTQAVEHEWMELVIISCISLKLNVTSNRENFQSGMGMEVLNWLVNTWMKKILWYRQYQQLARLGTRSE